VVIRTHQVGSYGPEVSKHPTDSGCYEIRFRGHLHARWSEWFDGLAVTDETDGTTLLRGDVDQAALHGLLRKLADLGLPLLTVSLVEPDATDTATAS